MANIYTPGEGYFSGIHAFSQGPISSQNTFLQNIAQNTQVRYATELEFAISKGRIAVAEEMGYGGCANHVPAGKFKREIFTFPLFKEVCRITGHEIQKRPATQEPNANWSTEEGQAFCIEQKMSMLYSRLQVARELMVSQLLLSGKLNFNVTEDVDLKRSTKLSKTITSKWNQENRDHDPIKDISEICIAVAQESGIRPTGILMDGPTYEQMRHSSRFLELASVTFTDVHLATKSNQKNGAVIMGTLMAGGCVLDVWVYNGVYEDSTDGKIKQFIPSGKVLVGDFKENNPLIKWYYGATDALQVHKDLAESLGLPKNEILNDIAEGWVSPTAWIAEDCLQFGLQTAMVCLPSDINMFGVMTVK